MITPPLASVCVPLFNKKDHLAKTLEAILAQTYARLEVVVSDNGSTDGSSAIAQEFARRDERVRYYRLENNLNINESWRYCWRLGSGEFLKIHSADDSTLPADFLERMIEPMLARPDLEFTVCAVEPVLEYTPLQTLGFTQTPLPRAGGEGMLASAAAPPESDFHGSYFRAVAELQRQLTAMPNRDARARKLLERSTFGNMVGTPYSIVCRRSCLPESSWMKTAEPNNWPESYPDWDFNFRLFLNHRGFFVDHVSAYLRLDAHHGFARAVVDSRYELFDTVDLWLFPVTVLIDPDLAAVRNQARPDELASMIQQLNGRIEGLMQLSDEIFAFDDPHFTTKVMPRLRLYIDFYRRNSQDWVVTKRLRQLRMNLAQHWLNIPPERIAEEYQGDVGRAHWLLVNSGLPRDKLDIREKELLETTYAELSAGMAPPASWGRLLAFSLLGNFQSRPNLTLEMVPDWMRADFAKYAWTG